MTNRRRARNARARSARWWLALSPLGFGSTHNGVPASVSALEPGDGTRPVERHPERPDPEHRHTVRPVSVHLSREATATAAKLGDRELVGGGRGPCHQIGDAQLRVEQSPLLPGSHQLIGEARVVERAPETIARPGEMMARGSRVEARIDAAEEHVQPRRDQIGDAAAGGRGDFARRGPRPALLVRRMGRQLGWADGCGNRPCLKT